MLSIPKFLNLTKRIFKTLFITFFILSIILLIGVLLPIETYSEKHLKINNLLIINCNIVDVIEGKIIPNKQVLVQNGKIVAIDNRVTLIPKNTIKIDVNGQYLTPSLWDMHIHTLSLSPQLHFSLLIANGVTGVRDLGDGDSWISDINDKSERDWTKWKRKAKNENLLLPKIFESTSYHVEDLEDVDNNNYKVKIADLVTKLKSRNESFVKVQLDGSDLNSEMFYDMQMQVKINGIPILGHLSPNVDIEKVMKNGFKSIEHAWALIPHCVKEKREFSNDIDQKKYDLKNQDSFVSNRVMVAIADAGTYYVPTHVTSNRKEYMFFDSNFNKNSNNRYIENTQLLLWKLAKWLHVKGYDKQTDLPVLKSYYDRGLEITKLAHDNGVKILAGTDSLDRNVYYGISLHEELIEMTKAGLTNAEALRTATYNAAEYYKVLNDYGSIAIDKKADFILLKKNPLEKIEHTQTINAVYYNNCWYDKNDLSKMKNFTKKQAKSFGISCKFIWNIIKQN